MFMCICNASSIANFLFIVFFYFADRPTLFFSPICMRNIKNNNDHQPCQLRMRKIFRSRHDAVPNKPQYLAYPLFSQIEIRNFFNINSLWSWLGGYGTVYGPGWEVYGVVYGPGWEVMGLSMVLAGRVWGCLWSWLGGYGAVYGPGWEVMGLSMVLAGRLWGCLWSWLGGTCTGPSPQSQWWQ